MATLLLADDSVTIQRVIELTFADEDVRVISVSDGESAIVRIDAESPDIVLADVGMPNIDGYQVAAHVKGTPALAHVPVLLLTGAFEPIDEGRARRTGCDGVLVKPFEPRQLVRTVRGLLSGERSADLWPADMPRVETREARPAPAPSSTPMPPDFAPPLQLVPPNEAEPDPLLTSYEAEAEADAEADPELTLALSHLEFVGLPDSPDLETVLEFDPVIPPQSRAPEDGPFATPMPDVSAGSAEGDPVSGAASEVEWDLSASPPVREDEVPAPPPGPTSLATAFSALLAAERGEPRGPRPRAVAPALSEAAVEEIVQRVVRRMTAELVRKTVLETAERLIREEIARIKSPETL